MANLYTVIVTYDDGTADSQDYRSEHSARTAIAHVVGPLVIAWDLLKNGVTLQSWSLSTPKESR